MKTSEAFNHAKNLKLYGWEQQFGDKISQVYDEEMRLHTRKMKFNGCNQCFQEMISNFLPLAVFSTYVYLGNEMSMSQIVLTSIMLNKFKDRLRHATHIYEMFKELAEAMEKIHKYYASDEVQSNIVKNTKDDKNNIALKVKGNFSWGFEKKKDEDEKEKDKEVENKEEKDTEKEKGEKDTKKVEEGEKDGKQGEDGEKEKNESRTLDSIMNLKDIDLEFKKGEFVIIIGKVGSGKSSLLSSITGDMLYVPEKEIKFAGGLEKSLSKNEYEGLKASLLDLEIKEGEAPIQVNGEISYVE